MKHLGRSLALSALLALAPALTQARERHHYHTPALVAWTGSWASAQQIPEPQNALGAADLTGATLRQVVHLSLGGQRLRVRISNAFGTQPLHVASTHVARATSAGSPRIMSGSDRAATFAGTADVVIPAGADYWSDPIELQVPALSSLSVSIYLDQAPVGQTSHPGSHATSYLAQGDQTSAADLPGARRVDHWFQLSGIDVARRGTAIVALGDSITDGHGATTNGDDRWPDDLAVRLQASRSTRSVAVLNVGIGGNRLRLDSLGPNALARFDRDVLAQAGVRTVILLEGINDVGMLTRDAPASPEAHAAMVQAVIDAYRQVILRAHIHGLKVIGATLTPFLGSDYYHPDASGEADRQAINRWIRSPGHFDGMIDFDRAIRDPAHPDRMTVRFDSGDHLHPSPAGYRAMAEAVPLKLVEP